MDIQEKLKILSQAAKYDVCCSSSGSNRKNNSNGIGNGHMSGICHSWSDDGRCISLLKILLTNSCIYNCAYCVNRCSNDIPRAHFTPEEIADITINFYKRNYIEGLFLSSAVFMNPDHTMELLLKSVKILRTIHRFNGYIHLKAIPGADFHLIEEAGKFADRMSVNIELPTNNSLKLLAPQKNKEAILKPMGFMKLKIAENREIIRNCKKPQLFLPAGQTTQLIIGATPDHDLSILRLSENLYDKLKLKRVYYSAYIPVSCNPKLPDTLSPQLLREHRLYQADWLLRYYGFKVSELLDENNPNFDTELDPKADWAIKNYSFFPVEINRADYHWLLRVPGIGVRSARRIVTARKMASLGYDDLKKLGVVLKRARHFITCRGKYYGGLWGGVEGIRQHLVTRPHNCIGMHTNVEQLSIFSYMNDTLSSITGEL